MLYIRTGLQGHGKTLNTIKEVDLSAKAQDRPVYFHNVTDLDPSKLQAAWFEFDDVLKWYELPENSIIVVDEAQGDKDRPMFGVRDPRKDVPLHISHFEIMRKRGYEVHLITQDPRFIDVHARRLCNKHIHYWRIFGSSKVSRYEMERVYNEVEKINSQKDASRTIISLDKRYFGVYSSAQAGHHFKFKPSRKVVFALAAVVLAGYFVFRALELVGGERVEEGDSAPAQSIGDQVKDVADSLLPGIAPTDASQAISAADFTAQRLPRVANLPASAPIYDELTKPQSFPRLYCMSSTDPDIYAREFSRMSSAVVNGRETVCQCYTQQGTRVSTDFGFCMQIVDNGYFDATLPDRSDQRRQQQAGEQQPAQLETASLDQQEKPRTAIAVIPYEKGKFLW